MVLKCSHQVVCEACKQPIRKGQWMNTLTVDHHNMGHTHKIIYVHEACTQIALEELRTEAIA